MNINVLRSGVVQLTKHGGVLEVVTPFDKSELKAYYTFGESSGDIINQ